MWYLIQELLFKPLAVLLGIYMVWSLLDGHHKHIQRVTLGLNQQVSYHPLKHTTLYCDGVVVGKGNIRYEGRLQRAKSVANSNGIWYIDNKVFLQKEGSVCEKRDN